MCDSFLSFLCTFINAVYSVHSQSDPHALLLSLFVHECWDLVHLSVRIFWKMLFQLLCGT